jgi:hypothetical protein
MLRGSAAPVSPESLSCWYRLAEADYGPRTRIGAKYQQWSNTLTSNCSGSISCTVLFQRAPQLKALIVQHVSCHAIASTGGLQVVRLATLNGPQTRTTLVPVPVGSRWAANSPVMHLVESGKRPVISFQNSTSTNWSLVECSISGQLK